MNEYRRRLERTQIKFCVLLILLLFIGLLILPRASDRSFGLPSLPRSISAQPSLSREERSYSRSKAPRMTRGRGAFSPRIPKGPAAGRAEQRSPKLMPNWLTVRIPPLFVKAQTKSVSCHLAGPLLGIGADAAETGWTRVLISLQDLGAAEATKSSRPLPIICGTRVHQYA